jgi:predicted PurR-regulated permease PerM
MENTSGQGKQAIVPQEITGWNWGAFIFSWLWGLFNGTYIALLSLIPYVGIIMVIILGIKGNEWAWRYKHWDNVEHFKKVQRKWAIAALILIGIAILGIIAAIMIPMLVKRP